MGLPVDMGGNDLYVDNVYVGNTSPGMLNQGDAVNLTGSTYTATGANEDMTFIFNNAAGTTVTLPAPVIGMTYTFVVGTVATSNAQKIITNSASVFISGGIYFDKSLTITRYDGNTSSIRSINLNGTTTGGATIGDTITLTCVSSTVWAASGTVTASGTLATPFATS